MNERDGAAMLHTRAKMKIWHRFIHPISAYFRSRRAQALLEYYPDLAELKICDLGGSKHFWEESKLHADPAKVTILNISAAETEGYGGDEGSSIQVVLYDGHTIPCVDNFYDLVLCNSVLEHVPIEERENFCREMRRVAKRGYLQTPAFEFPVEPHFVLPMLHWLPRAVGRIVARISPWAILSRPSETTFRQYFEGTLLLSRREIAALFPGATIGTERFLGMPKSHLVFWDRRDEPASERGQISPLPKTTALS